MKVPFHTEKKFWGIAGISLFLLYWVVMILIYPHLPEQIPVHFNLSGEATRYSETGFASWFLLPVIVTFTGLHTLLIGWAFLTAGIESLNFPEKKRILTLSREEQKPFKKIIRGYVIKTQWITLNYVMVIFLLIAVYTWLYSTDSNSFSLGYPILGLTILYLYLITIDYFNLKRTFSKKLSKFAVGSRQ